MGIFVDPKNHLSPEEEKERYSQHNNDIYDFDYRKFLLTLYDPIAQKLKRGARGLEYGSGPGPALAEMF